MKTWSRFPTPLLLLPFLPLLQACGGDAGAWEGTVTDSAGISVVHNTATPIWGSGDQWTVTEELRIGTVAGDPEYQFGQIFPVASIDVDPTGNIYVMDVQANEARIFDSNGEFRQSIGGPGSGPGELSPQAFFLFATDDGRVIIPDLGNQRVSVFGSDGELMGSFPIQFQAGIPALWEVDSQGRIIAQIRGIDVPGMAALEEGDPIVVYDTTGAVVDTLALLPKGETVQEISEGAISMLMFAPEPTWALDDTGAIFSAMSDDYRILVNGPDGTLTRVITKEVERRAVSESDKAAILRFFRSQMEQAGAPPAAAEQFLQGVGFAETYPAMGRFLLGPGGTLWVQGTRAGEDLTEGAEEGTEIDLQDLGSPDWDVFDADGRFLGVVTLPDRFQPVTVQGEHLYGVLADELDVQYVVRLKVNH